MLPVLVRRYEASTLVVPSPPRVHTWARDAVLLLLGIPGSIPRMWLGTSVSICNTNFIVLVEEKKECDGILAAHKILPLNSDSSYCWSELLDQADSIATYVHL